MTHTEIVKSQNLDELTAECLRLRQGLWDCFSASGGDTDGDKDPKALTSDIVQLVVSAVEELVEDYRVGMSDL